MQKKKILATVSLLYASILNAASVCMVLPPQYSCYISCMHFIIHSYRADWGWANCWGSNCRGGTACDPATSCLIWTAGLHQEEVS